MKKIIIAIDSFKGCLSSIEAGKAAAAAIKSICPTCETIVFPVADGGEGTLTTLVSALRGDYVSTNAHNSLMEPIRTQYGVSGDRKTALIEMATTCGLTLIPPSLYNPLLTTTYGLGEVIADALNKGYRDFIIGIGGSATNDAGIGMLQALGYRFPTSKGIDAGTGGQAMTDIETVDATNIHPALKDAHFTIACDVDNPFYGHNGAAHVYAPQKGADAAMIEILDRGMRSFARVIHSSTGKDISHIPGTGAAGGIGGGFLAFLNAELKSGARLFLDALDFGKQIANADLIITGEGHANRQTLRGKTAFGILTEARKQKIPVILIAGGIEDFDLLNEAGFRGVFSITPGPITLEKAMEADFTKKNITRLVTQICRLIQD